MAFLTTALYLLLFRPSSLLRAPPDFSRLADHCASVRPIPPASYVERQDTLAHTLHALGAAAYVAEPGPSAAFFANFSGAAWHLSERPLLLVLTPAVEQGRVAASLSVLTPSFEATRARLLPIPSGDDVAYPEWAEDMDPYEVALSSIPGLRGGGTIFVDGATRQFIVEGLQKAAGSGTRVVGAPAEVRRLRERKSKEEIEILKCVNEVRCRDCRPRALNGLSPGDCARDQDCKRRNVHWHARVGCPPARRKRACRRRPAEWRWNSALRT